MDILLPTAVLTLSALFLLYFAIEVRKNEPITADEAKILWKIHKKTTHCTGKNWQPIATKRGKLKGFRCECGYNYAQKRPLISGTHKTIRQNYWDSLEM
jgi:hypothetical protein